MGSEATVLKRPTDSVGFTAWLRPALQEVDEADMEFIPLGLEHLHDCKTKPQEQ